MDKVTTTMLDLAKHAFHMVCCDIQGKVVKKRMLRRSQVVSFFANHQALPGWPGSLW